MTKKLIHLLAVVWLLSSIKTNAQSYQWGAATNGLRLGSSITETNWMTQPPFLCTIYLTNVTSKKILLRVPPIKERYEITLQYLLGQETKLSSDKVTFNTISGNRPIILWTNDIADTSSFFIMDNFKIETNGVYMLIISSRAATNFIPPKREFPFNLFSPPPVKPAYFLLPPVTNTFTVLPEQLKK